MEAFSYANPSSLSEALSLLPSKWGGTEVLAGGTDLLSRMKDHVSTPERLVNIKGVSELRKIEEADAAYRIGALVTFDELLAHEPIEHSFPSLVEAARGVSSPQIRTMGTVGGDLLQRPRCWFYRAGYGLLAQDDKGKSLVPGGDNRYHAILGNEGPAYFVSPSSLAPALFALNAKFILHGPAGHREVSAESFFVSPKSKDEREHAIKPNELLTQIAIPASSREWRNATYEVREKMALDWPLATASVALKMEGSRIASARIVLGHVAPVPWPARAAEKALEGKTLSEETAAAAGDAAVEGAKPLSHNGYKVQLARVCVKRALLAAGKESA
ncbi:MAG TPA: FAD binding domain-containing protein [Candidatus Acidoferrales bacterium]|nr:FAD binding domain-containing protein [Candidatus Acidoferrales bacterium]